MERQELIELCEAAIVSVEKWSNRDSASAQRQIGEAWALLRAGATFCVRMNDERDMCVTNDSTIWIDITFDGFGSFEGGVAETELFYIPTWERLSEDGSDWY